MDLRLSVSYKTHTDETDTYRDSLTGKTAWRSYCVVYWVVSAFLIRQWSFRYDLQM